MSDVKVIYNSDTRMYELYNKYEIVAIFSEYILGDKLAKLLAYSSMKKLTDYYS